MIIDLAFIEMEIPRHCEERSNLVDCNVQQELQLLKMRKLPLQKKLIFPLTGFIQNFLSFDFFGRNDF